MWLKLTDVHHNPMIVNMDKVIRAEPSMSLQERHDAYENGASFLYYGVDDDDYVYVQESAKWIEARLIKSVPNVIHDFAPE